VAVLAVIYAIIQHGSAIFPYSIVVALTLIVGAILIWRIINGVKTTGVYTPQTNQGIKSSNNAILGGEIEKIDISPDYDFEKTLVESYSDETAEDIDLKKAVIKLNNRKFIESIAYSSEVVGRNPLSGIAYAFRAYAKHEYGANSINDYNKAIEFGYNNYGVYFGRANVLASERKFIEAINDLSRAITLCFENNHGYKLRDSGVFKVFHQRGFARYLIGDISGAIEDYSQAIDNKHNFSLAYYNRGVAQYWNGDIDGAISDFARVAWGSTKYRAAISHKNLGIIRLQMDNFDKALKEFNQSVLYNTSDATTYYWRAAAKHNKEDYTGAVSDCNKAISLIPRFVDALILLGRAKTDSEDLNGAMLAFSKAAELQPDYFEIYYHRAEAYEKQNDTEAAMADYKKALELNPEMDEAHNSIGLLHAEAGNHEKAIQCYNNALKVEPKNTDYLFNRALAKKAAGNTTGAIDDYLQILKIDKKYTDAIENLGVLYYDNREFKNALEYFIKLRDYGIRDADVFHSIGLCLHELGIFNGALKSFEKALEMRPDDEEIKADLQKTKNALHANNKQ